jgi:hypothetical protein
VLLARAVFFFLALVAGGRCVGAAVGVRFVFLSRVAGGRCLGAAVAVRFLFLARVAGGLLRRRFFSRGRDAFRWRVCAAAALRYFLARAAGVRRGRLRFRRSLTGQGAAALARRLLRCLRAYTRR